MGVMTSTQSAASPSQSMAQPSVEEVKAHFPELEVLEIIGVGGMGAVYKARQSKLDRLVALKILSSDLAGDPAFLERFEREARVLARLNHPNIVTVFDTGTAGPFAYLIMEHVDGVNLRQAMQAGRFTPTEALTLVQDVCAALKFAHEKGILHRDIKPENILIDARGQVKIADFGIAKLLGEHDLEQVTLTQRGFVLGSPHYMAPEQLESPENVDQRADIYSLGVVLYELLTGELPLGRFAPPSKKSTVDSRIDEIVMRTLERERELRFQTIGEVKTRVEDVTHSGDAGPQDKRLESAGVAPARKTARFATAALIFTVLSVPVGLLAVGGLLQAFMIQRGMMPVGVFILAAFFLVLLGATAGVGMLFGARAGREIRSSRGKLAGLKRAVVSALSWPALLMMLMLLGAIATLFADNGVGTVWRMLLVVLLLIASGLDVVMILRTLRWIKDPSPAAAKLSGHVWRFAASAVVAAICVIAYIREERVTRAAYLEPSGTKVTVDMSIPAGKMQTYRVVRIDLEGAETSVDIDGSISAPVDQNLQTRLMVTTTDRWKESPRQKIEASYQALSGEIYKKSAFLDDHWKFTTSGEMRAPMDGKKDRLELATRHNWLGKKVETLYLENVDSTNTPLPAPAVEKQP
jgi:tRNA A-37 threonylcarbamoyl transferase component Bud32